MVLVPPVSGDLRLMFAERFQEWKWPLVQAIGLAASRLGPHGGLGLKLCDVSRRRPYRWSGPWLRGIELWTWRSLDGPLESVTAGGRRPLLVASDRWPLGDSYRSGPGVGGSPACTGRHPTGGTGTHRALCAGVLRLAFLPLLHTCFGVGASSVRLFVLDMLDRLCSCTVPIHTHTRTHTGSRVVSWGPDGAPRIVHGCGGRDTMHCFHVAARRDFRPRETGWIDRAPGGWSPFRRTGRVPRFQAVAVICGTRTRGLSLVGVVVKGLGEGKGIPAEGAIPPLS